MLSAARVAAFAFASVVARAAIAQDLAVIAIDAPHGGCALGSTENVALRLFNYGAALPAGSTFIVSYAVDGGASVIEPVVLASPLLRDSTFAYTFATPANLAAPGSYRFDLTVALAGDVNPANDTLAGFEVRNWAPSVGGSAAGPSDPVFAGTSSLSGQLGDILEWQQSDDGGRRWRRLSNADATLAFDQLRRDTAFRALVRNGSCPPALSSPAAVTSSDPIFYSGFES